MKKNYKFILLFLAITFLFPFFSSAQTIHQDLQGVWNAKVLEVVSEKKQNVPGTDTETVIQELQIEILEGERKGEVIELKNDFTPLRENQKFFLSYLITIDGQELFAVRDIDRRGALLVLALFFVAVVILFGKKQGVRSIISLLASFAVIIYVLLPLLLLGYNPVVISVAVGSLILFVAIFFTHGFTFHSFMAFAGTALTIILTGILAFVSIELIELTGFFSDETVYLNFGTNGVLDFKGLLLGGMIIGVLGVLDDIAITQVSVVAELSKNASQLTTVQLFESAMRVGREHVGALVNTIVLAYAGVSLPLLLWFSQSEASFSTIINNEVFATEIVRTIVGSIGLIMAVPITTYLAVIFKNKLQNSKVQHSHHH
jgi:uncharacterized membrane protein